MFVRPYSPIGSLRTLSLPIRVNVRPATRLFKEVVKQQPQLRCELRTVVRHSPGNSGKKMAKIGMFLLAGSAVTGGVFYASQTGSKDPLVRKIETYFKSFEGLAKSENWKEILAQGTEALAAAKASNRLEDEAKIYAQLTSTAFYMGDYTQAHEYATCCRELSKKFPDQTLFMRALYLESAVYRALAGKVKGEKEREEMYRKAVGVGMQASSTYVSSKIEDNNLKGKIHFNLGAAYADNPKGDLKKAAVCYSVAIQCFQIENAMDDLIRTSIRLGKVYLLQGNFELSQRTLDSVRPLISNQRLSIHADFLEAQIKLAQNENDMATEIAEKAMERAKHLGAKEDELRLHTLLQTIRGHSHR